MNDASDPTPMDDADSCTWEPFTPRANRLRIASTSCCGAYELAAEGGQYFVLKRAGGGYQETGRGTYAHAAAIFHGLASQHRCRRQTASPHSQGDNDLWRADGRSGGASDGCGRRTRSAPTAQA
ncbi:MAG TPA: hypothetical protein VFV66_17055 [Nonomuraea sp.]|nr:hypothetical protein [Nonomuraea sp.]